MYYMVHVQRSPPSNVYAQFLNYRRVSWVKPIQLEYLRGPYIKIHEIYLLSIYSKIHLLFIYSFWKHACCTLQQFKLVLNNKQEDGIPISWNASTAQDIDGYFTNSLNAHAVQKKKENIYMLNYLNNSALMQDQ